MKTETKNEIKKNAATGASTAAGATAGVVMGAALTPDNAEAAETSTPQHTHTPSQTPDPAAPEKTSVPEEEHNQEQNPGDKPIVPEPPTPEPEPEPEIEVLSYDRVINEDGSQVEIAVLNVNGNEVGVIDVDLDGEADILACDVNNDGVIDENEAEFVAGQGIEMQPLADAAGFNSQFAQNDLPDYVNDADVDTFMA